ncbi:unnamed protein product [Camellia sinensis]
MNLFFFVSAKHISDSSERFQSSLSKSKSNFISAIQIVSEIHEKMSCIRCQNYDAVVDDMLDEVNEVDGARSTNEGCQSDQEDIGGFASISGTLSAMNKDVNWKEYAPAIQDYNNFLAKAIAGGTGHIVKVIFKCSNAYTNQVYLDFSFPEMNPFTLVNGEPYPLDMRAELDDTAAFKNFKKWGDIEFPLPFGRVLSPTESFIHSLDEKVKTVPIRTVNRQCSSSLQAVADVVAAIKAGFYDIGRLLLQLPLVNLKRNNHRGYQIVDPKTGDEKPVTISVDDGIWPNTTISDLAKLKPAFKKDGTTTAGIFKHCWYNMHTETQGNKDTLLYSGTTTAGIFKHCWKGDLLMELAAGVELATTTVPHLFLPLACATNVAKNVGVVTSTSNALQYTKAFPKVKTLGMLLRRENVLAMLPICVEGQTEEVIFDHLHATAFQHTPLGRTILGPAQNVRTITKDHLQKYISTHYTTSRMVIVASGAVKHEDLVEQVKKLFTKLSSDPTTTSELVAKGPAIFSGFFVLKSFGFLFLLFFLFFLGSDSG